MNTRLQEEGKYRMSLYFSFYLMYISCKNEVILLVFHLQILTFKM